MRFWTKPSIAFGIAVLATTWALAAEEKANLKVGDKAPDFQGTDDQGKAWKSKNHVGKKRIVVFFYPANFTGG